MEFRHTPVLLNEVLSYMNPRPDGVYADGTLGGGGHAYHIAKCLAAGGRLIGFDQDEAAVEAASKRLSPMRAQVTIVRDNYANLPAYLQAHVPEGVDGILLDLGVSSYQLDNAERGFSYRADAPLDMRMDRRQALTAKDIVNTWPETRLKQILYEYGEERFAPAIARRIAAEREIKEIQTTGELSEIICAAIPKKARARSGHPAKRTFQAIRIACNRELEVLSESLDGLIECLKPQGRLCVISFHSLEDRIVKNAFRQAERPCVCPPEFPVCVCGRTAKGSVLTRKAIQPGPEESAENPRAASAKLRVFEKG